MGRSTKAPRGYRLGRRAEAAAETRRRIVKATFELHSEQGIADTSMTDIAQRAGVSVGTVYHHFATYAEAIVACGAYVAEHEPAPTAAIFDGVTSRRARVEGLVYALFKHYLRVPALESVRRDRDLTPELDAFAREETKSRRMLAARAAGPRDAALVAAFTDIDVFRALRREGFSAADAAGRVAESLNLLLDAGRGAGPRSN